MMRPENDQTRRVIKAAQGNFDHLMGQLRHMAKYFNLMQDQIGGLDERMTSVDGGSAGGAPGGHLGGGFGGGGGSGGGTDTSSASLSHDYFF